MGYRGEDLDLRTPQTWSATPADLAGASDGPPTPNGLRTAYRNGPIWVDETVLACSNHAYDIALAHRSGEVRLEHLLHALTRIDAAAEALEARGVRVAALRRESATIIASEIPVGLANGKSTPRRSEDFAEVLRLAAAAAARRNAPANIDDLLNVLFDQRTDAGPLGLLSRHISRTLMREVVEPLPPIARYVSEPRYVTRTVERYVKAEPEAPRYVSEPVREPIRETVVREPVRYRTEPAQSMTDAMQNSRIEALEQLVRQLGNDLANERQTMAGMLKELSRDTQAQRDDQGRLHTGLYDRMQTLEQVLMDAHTSGASPDGAVLEHVQQLEMSLDQRLQDMSKSWAAISGRIQDLERAVREQAGGRIDTAGIIDGVRRSVDLSPIVNRLDIIEEAVLSREQAAPQSDVADRLVSLEGAIARALASNTASTGRMETLISGFERQRVDMSGPIVARLDAVGEELRSHTTAAYNAAYTGLNELAERISAVERAVAAEIETAAAKHQAYAQDLGEVHDALMKLNQNQHTLAGSIDQWRTDAAGDIAMISNSLNNLDRDNERPIETLNTLTSHMDTMNRMFIERYHRRNRFWYWLFGTDDWIGRSWPSQVAALEADKTKLRPPVQPQR